MFSDTSLTTESSPKVNTGDISNTTLTNSTAPDTRSNEGNNSSILATVSNTLNSSTVSFTNNFTTTKFKNFPVELTNIYGSKIDNNPATIVAPAINITDLKKTQSVVQAASVVSGNSKISLTNNLITTANNNEKISLTNSPVAVNSTELPNLVTPVVNDFYNTSINFDKTSTVLTPQAIRPTVDLVDSNNRFSQLNSNTNFASDAVPPTILDSNNLNQESLVVNNISNILPELVLEENINLLPTNTNSAYSDNGVIFNTLNGGIELASVLRNILQPLPADIIAPAPNLIFDREKLKGITAEQTAYNKQNFSRQPIDVLEKNHTHTPSFTVQKNTSQVSTLPTRVPGTDGLDVANAEYFLQSVLGTPAGALPKGALWALSFDAPENDSYYYTGGIPTGCINQISRYEPRTHGGWDINNATSALTVNSYNGAKGCMFAQSVRIPDESYVANPDGTLQRNGLITSYVGGGRNAPATLSISFLETNVDFVDNVLKPWTIMSGHFGLIARTGNQRYRTNIRFYKLGLTSRGNPPTILEEYYFVGVCPIRVSGTEYTYDSVSSPTRKTVDFTYHYYSINSSKNTLANYNSNFTDANFS
jgi:hypothetical protein